MSISGNSSSARRVALLASVVFMIAAVCWLRLDLQVEADSPAALGAAAASAPQPREAPPHAAVPVATPLNVREALLASYALTVTTRMPADSARPTLAIAATVDFGRDLAGGPDLAGDAWVVGRIRDLSVKGTPDFVTRFGVGANPAREVHRFAAEVDETGEITQLRFDKTMPFGLRNTIATALYGLAVARDGADAQDRWSRIEADGNGGSRLVSYAKTEATVSKSWEYGTTVHAPDAPPGRGETRLTYDAHGLQAATCHYTRKVGFGTRGVGDTSVAGLPTLARATPPEDAEEWVESVDPTELVPPNKEALPAPSPPAAALADSIDGFLDLASSAHHGRRFNERVAVVRSFAEWLAADDARVVELAARLGAGESDPDRLRVLSEALTLAGTGAAQDAHAAAIANPATPADVRFSLVVAVTFHEQPGEALVTALLQQLELPEIALRLPAALALAAQANLQADRFPSLATQLSALILERAVAALQPPEGAAPVPVEEQRMWLRALGNRGGKDIWSIVQPYLKAQDGDSRWFAIEALRFVRMPAARQALAAAILAEPYARNRRAAVETAMYHPQQAMQGPVLKALMDDPHGSVRLGAAYAVAAWSVVTPALQTALDEAVAREVNPQVKEILTGLAEKYDVEPSPDETLEAQP